MARLACDAGDRRSLAERAVVERFRTTLGLEDARGRAISLAERALERFDDEDLTSALHGGAVGTGWCLQYMMAGGVPRELGDRIAALLSEVDEAVGDALSGPTDGLDAGIVHGLAGLGLYALERRNAQLVDGVVEALDRRATVDGTGRTFYTPPDCTGFPDYFHEGHFNLGLAHGVAGALMFLARAHRAQPSATAGALIEDLVGWLLQRERPDGHSALPAIAVCHDSRDMESDAGWAHGDAGVGSAIVAAGAALQRPDWRVRGRRIVERSLARPVETYVDPYGATITHGCAGLAQIYDRLGQGTGDERLLEGARAWSLRMLELLDAEAATAAGRPIDATDDRGARTISSGSAGIALVLMTALHGVEPGWDACLGLQG